MYKKIVSLSWFWSFYGAVILTGVYFWGKYWFIGLFTNLQTVIDLCEVYAHWMIFFPICASVGLIFYGVFTGISSMDAIRNSMILALVVYLIAQAVLVPNYGNHGLWISFLLFTASRSLFLVPYILRTKTNHIISVKLNI